MFRNNSIGPLALTARSFHVYLDERALAHESIALSAGQRGAQVVLAPADLITVTGARPVALAP